MAIHLDIDTEIQKIEPCFSPKQKIFESDTRNLEFRKTLSSKSSIEKMHSDIEARILSGTPKSMIKSKKALLSNETLIIHHNT